LDSNERSKDFDEFIERSKPVSAAIREFRKTMPMDLFVYTFAEFEYLRKEKDFFVEEIMENGKVLYEKQHYRMGIFCRKRYENDRNSHR
jgi:citrate lyase synthetase